MAGGSQIISVWVDGTLALSSVGSANNKAWYVGLFTTTCTAQIRNIKLWTLTVGLPV
jgi:hypothetical protein